MDEICCLLRMKSTFTVVGGSSFVVDGCNCDEAVRGCHGGCETVSSIEVGSDFIEYGVTPFNRDGMMGLVHIPRMTIGI